MKILVTGGTGFSGKALVRRLLDQGHQVVALDYKEGLKTRELREWGAEVVLGSVTDPEVVRRSMRGVEAVHHLAAAFREMNVPDSHYWDVNVQGTRNVLEAALAARGCASSSTAAPAACTATSTGRPAARTRRSSPPTTTSGPSTRRSRWSRSFTRRGLPSVILRPAAIYGPGDPERFLMIYRRVARGSFPMFGDGKTLYHPLYIDNLVDAFVLAMADGAGDGEAYLIADEEYLGIEELVRRVGKSLGVEVKVPHYPVWPVVAAGHVVEKICRPFGITPPIFPRRVDWYRQNRAFKIDKAKRDLGYAPRVGIDEGLRRTAEWYRAKGYL